MGKNPENSTHNDQIYREVKIVAIAIIAFIVILVMLLISGIV